MRGESSISRRVSQGNGACKWSAADRLLAVAPMLEQNRQREPRHGRERRPSLNQMAALIAAEHGVSARTVRRWYYKFLRGGYSALVHSRRDRGTLRYIASHPEIEAMIQARMGRGRSAFSIWKSLCIVLSSAAPSYQIVLSYVKARGKEAVCKRSERGDTEAMVAG